MMIDIRPTIHDIVARLDVLSDKLKRATGDTDRQALLKQFRMLLDEADRVIERDWMSE